MAGETQSVVAFCLSFAQRIAERFERFEMVTMTAFEIAKAAESMRERLFADHSVYLSKPR